MPLTSLPVPCFTLVSAILAGGLCGCGGHETAPVSCRADEFSPTAVMRSTDRGATWTRLGRICMHDPSILSVDPTAIPVDGGVALYFVDLKLLQQPPSVQRFIYRATTKDGVNFDRPEPVLTANVDMVDPAVVRTPEGRIRLYVPMPPAMISAVSDDGRTFTRESGVRTTYGGFPGALVLADQRVRLFLTGALVPDQPGIFSMVSDDGLNFSTESGLRIAAAGGKPSEMPFDASPIHLLGGGYLMAFVINPSDPPVATKGEYRLATSADGLTWTVNPTVFAVGGTSCLVETSNGTLFFYYGEGV